MVELPCVKRRKVVVDLKLTSARLDRCFPPDALDDCLSRETSVTGFVIRNVRGVNRTTGNNFALMYRLTVHGLTSRNIAASLIVIRQTGGIHPRQIFLGSGGIHPRQKKPIRFG